MKKINEQLKKMYEEQQKALEIEILKKSWCKDIKEFLEKWYKVKFLNNSKDYFWNLTGYTPKITSTENGVSADFCPFEIIKP